MAEKLFRKAIDFLSSYALAIVLLLLLLVLTLLGTLEQGKLGLFEVQKRYFESIFFVTWIGGKIPVLLPGVYLVLVLLTVNLLLGGFLKVKRAWSRVGIYIAHFGILVLLVSSFVSHEMSQNGHITLYEGQSADEFVSYYDWEVAIYPATNRGPVTELLIPEDQLTDLDAGTGASRTFTSADLPFDLTVWGWLPNCAPVTDRSGVGAFGGFLLQPLDREKEAEANVAGAYVAVKEKKSGKITRGILWGEARPPWGRQVYPLLVRVDGQKWAIDLRKVRKNLPFRLTLEKFHHEYHPGTRTPKVFRSTVLKTDPVQGTERELRIQMNEPLRDGGYTVYQSSWGPQNSAPGARLFSGFSVAKNPADKMPLVSCIIIVSGLVIHFLRKLLSYVGAEERRRRST